ncbi:MULTISPECIES: hypothetical protein [unclassified Flavobacterium]|uniref:hypothetical protein n=1 Tax=unclassified Flavobacterium TaxID=196869 RepID=UPI0006AB93CF|nr:MULTISPECIES: hypothetical protein [unclassified Flavobacterium]KOP39662.1 hypothetical protein AKO67_03670 [Flavobacterium sp. VMW]OWU90215.1 hypothetical protein APR43_14150 [Flavobacterium sp. NLM]
MIEDVLTNCVYLYYPKNVCPWDDKEKYLKTLEYKRLQSLIDYFDSDGKQSVRNNIKKEFQDDVILKDFEDFSILDSNQDRCYTFFLNVFEGGELYSISLYLSFLIPYYTIRKQWHPAEPFYSKERIKELEKEKLDKRKIDELVLAVESIVENKLFYKKFPRLLMEYKILDVSFGDIYLGNFTMYNAFFNNRK